MTKNLKVIVIIGIMILSNFKAIAQADVLNHGRSNAYYVGWDATGTSGTLEIKNDFNSSINFSTSTTQQATILANGNVGIGTVAPSSLLSLGGDAARTIQMERHSTTNTAGNSLTVLAGGATIGATNQNGGALILAVAHPQVPQVVL